MGVQNIFIVFYVKHNFNSILLSGHYLIMKNIEIGKIGENIAYKYLSENEYLILSRNHREGCYEIDIIARDKDGILIFCEVKTINNKSLSPQFMPEDNLSAAKLQKMIRASEIFLARYPESIANGRGWRIDAIAIVLENTKLTDLRHYKNI